MASAFMIALSMLIVDNDGCKIIERQFWIPKVIKNKYKYSQNHLQTYYDNIFAWGAMVMTF